MMVQSGGVKYDFTDECEHPVINGKDEPLKVIGVGTCLWHVRDDTQAVAS